MANNNRTTAWAWLLIVFVLGIVLYRWDDSRKQVRPTEGASTNMTLAPKASLSPSLLSAPASQLDLFDLTMAKSSAYRLSGDLRPIYIVSRNIKNLTEFTIKDAEIQVRILRKTDGLEIDSNRFVVSTTIPPAETISFRGD
jgi:hypothetical protein